MAPTSIFPCHHPLNSSKSRQPEPEVASESERDDNEVLVIGNMPVGGRPRRSKGEQAFGHYDHFDPTSARSELSASGSSYAGSDDESHSARFDPNSGRAKWGKCQSVASPRTPTSFTYSVPLAENPGPRTARQVSISRYISPGRGNTFRSVGRRCGTNASRGNWKVPRNLV